MPSQYASVTAASSRATLQAAPPPLPAGERGFEPRFVPGTRTGGGGPPGFPSLYTIKTSAELRRIGVNVFGMPSRKESIILQLKVWVWGWEWVWWWLGLVARAWRPLAGCLLVVWW